LPSDLRLKGFYSVRDKSGLEGMTQILTMIGASEGAMLGTAERIKIQLFILKNDRESYGYFSYRFLYL
jgi:hypothetical protein